MKKAIIVFQKFPEAGKVKTRLAKSIGEEKAAKLYAFLLRHTHQQLEEMGASIFVFHQGPVVAHEYPEQGYFFFPQKGNDLGEKMALAFQKVFEMGFDQVLVIGTDCYELKSKHLHQAFSALGKNDVVLGPARDGGYYLLGMKKFRSHLFQGISWSTSTVLHATLKKAVDAGLSTSLLDTLNDVDRYEDLGELKDMLDQF
ncbi:TIGR04282 family arsenosugar biosynthesis glycosyltransferase [Cyclobacterium plantarum]|uniref:TIGR04282 family arsenosugar biosynthesis glycosyltransferase n=1 Tax=Cyclobacterium plantarum TaxID=2716263 RepID=UPI003F6F7C5E